MIKNLLTFAKARSIFGSQKYRIENPAYADGKEPDVDDMPPWGSDPTIELFWFRNLPEDMREELADAQVYSERLTIRTDTIDIPEVSRIELKDATKAYQDALTIAYLMTERITDVLEMHAPELLEDHEEMWGKHSPRLTFSAE